MLDLFGKYVIGETLEARIVKFFDMHETGEGLLENLLTSTFIKKPVATSSGEKGIRR